MMDECWQGIQAMDLIKWVILKMMTPSLERNPPDRVLYHHMLVPASDFAQIHDIFLQLPASCWPQSEESSNYVSAQNDLWK